MSKNPLAEVFGFAPTDFSEEAIRHRRLKLCPFGNKVPNCTKDKANAPLGVCSVFEGDSASIVCPIRFRENWVIAEDAARFFFGESATWTSLTEVKLKDAGGKSAGNIDVVLVQYDERGKVVDFGSLEIQAVYISGNIRDPFEHYMEDPRANAGEDWRSQAKYYPNPDYLSSSRKRLVPQMLFKGGIFKAWGKKQAVALQNAFFNTLPKVPEVSESKAELAWLIYDLTPKDGGGFTLEKIKTVYTEYSPALDQIIKPNPGKVTDFIKVLQNKLNESLETPPDAPTLSEMNLF